MNASALAFANVQSGPLPLARRDAQSVLNKNPNLKSVAHVVSFAKQHKADGMANHYGALPNPLGEKIRTALLSRMFPNTNLTRKQIVHALDISAGTMDNLLSGNRDPSGRTLHKLVDFFGASFLHEVFGGPNIHVIDPRATQKAARIAELHEELRRLG